MKQQPLDPYVQQGRLFASEVARIKGWVGSDPAGAGELADALNALTAHRLLGHAYANSAAEAQEAMTLAARALALAGPLGPYTPPADAARLFTAAVHLAVLQAAAGLPDASARTLATAQGLRAQVDVTAHLAPWTMVWALMASARLALAVADPVRANSFADAAAARLVMAGSEEDPDSYLPMDVYRLVSDCRWAAGQAQDAVLYALRAVELYGDVALDRLLQPGRLNDALLERLTEPAFGVYSDAADRLIASGDAEFGINKRRELAGLLGMLVERGGDALAAQLAQVDADLVADLRRCGRTDEADLVLADRDGLAATVPRPAAELPSTPVDWKPLDSGEAFGPIGRGLAQVASELLRVAAETGSMRALYRQGEAERRTEALAELARREADRLAEERAAAVRAETERRAAEKVEAERAEAERVEAERRADEEVAARAESQRRRLERIEAHRLEAERRQIERLEAQRSDAKRRPPADY